MCMSAPARSARRSPTTFWRWRVGKGAKYEDFKYYPSTWNDVHRDRRRGVGWSLYSLVGVAKGDREGSARQSARNFLFFDAPVGRS